MSDGARKRGAELESLYDGAENVLMEKLPNMPRGARIEIHDPECAVDDETDEGCDCEILVVSGPSGKA